MKIPLFTQICQHLSSHSLFVCLTSTWCCCFPFLLLKNCALFWEANNNIIITKNVSTLITIHFLLDVRIEFKKIASKKLKLHSQLYKIKFSFSLSLLMIVIETDVRGEFKIFNILSYNLLSSRLIFSFTT